MATEEMVVRAAVDDDASRPMRLIRGEVDRATRSVQRLATTSAATGTGTGRLTRNVNQLATSTSRVDRVMRSASRSIGQDFGRAVTRVSGAVALLTGGVGVFGVKSASNFEQARISLDGFLGSAEAGGAMFAALQEANKKTPFELGDLTAGARTMLGFGFASEQVLPVLKSLTDAAAGLGAGNDGLQRLILNLGQVRTTGKVTGRELRDFAVLGFPGYQIVADILGVTTDQVRALGDEAEVSGEQFIAAVTAQGGALARFAGQAEAQSRTLAGLWSNIKDLFTINLVESMGPTIDRLKELIAPGGTVFRLVDTFATTMGPPLASLFGTLADLVANVLVVAAPVIEVIAEGLSRLLGAMEPAFGAMAPLGDRIAASLVRLVEELVPVMPDLVDAFIALVGLLPALIDLFTMMVPVVIPLVRVFTDLLSLGPVKTMLAGVFLVLLGYRAVVAPVLMAVGALYRLATAIRAVGVAEAVLGGGRALGAAGGAAGALGRGGLIAGGLRGARGLLGAPGALPAAARIATRATGVAGAALTGVEIGTAIRRANQGFFDTVENGIARNSIFQRLTGTRPVQPSGPRARPTAPAPAPGGGGGVRSSTVVQPGGIVVDARGMEPRQASKAVAEGIRTYERDRAERR